MRDFGLVIAAPQGRFDGIERPYSAEDVLKLRGSIPVEHTLARRGALKLWELLHEDEPVRALGAVSGNQAMQMVRAGLKAIYLSGWQVAADSNVSGSMYPDQSLYPANSGPELARKINKTLQRADQIEHMEGGAKRDWFAPILADAEAGFGGPLNCFEIMKAYIEAGAAGVHFEDQLASEKKCGHFGGKVLIPTQAAIRNLDAARLAADVCGVPTILVARTDAESAKLITSDVDERDRAVHYRRADARGLLPPEGRHRPRSLHRPRPRLRGACRLAVVRDQPPESGGSAPLRRSDPRAISGQATRLQLLPSFNWKAKLDEATIASFQRELGAMGYKFQFVTLAGFHSLNHAMFELASDYRDRGMAAYSELQQAEFASEAAGYTATRHQREVGTGYFDAVASAVSGGQSSTTALKESTEAAQFAPRLRSQPSRRTSWDSVTGSSAANIADCRFNELEPGTEVISGPFADELQGADGMAAPDLPRSLRGDRTLLDLRGAGATVSPKDTVLDRPTYHCRTLQSPRGRRGPDRSGARFPRRAARAVRRPPPPLLERATDGSTLRRWRASRFPRGHARHPRKRLDRRRDPARPHSIAGSRSPGRPTPRC